MEENKDPNQGATKDIEAETLLMMPAARLLTMLCTAYDSGVDGMKVPEDMVTTFYQNLIVGLVEAGAITAPTVIEPPTPVPPKIIIQ